MIDKRFGNIASVWFDVSHNGAVVSQLADGIFLML